MTHTIYQNGLKCGYCYCFGFEDGDVLSVSTTTHDYDQHCIAWLQNDTGSTITITTAGNKLDTPGSHEIPDGQTLKLNYWYNPVSDETKLYHSALYSGLHTSPAASSAIIRASIWNLL